MEHEHRQQEQGQPYIPIFLNLQISHFAAVFDLSLTHPFEIFLEIKRGQRGDNNPRPLTIWKTLSVLDSVHALSMGLLQLIDLETNIAIDLKDIDKIEFPKISGLQTCMNDNKFITLPARDRIAPPVPRLVPRGYDSHVDLEFPVKVKDQLKAGHKYRLQLASTDLDIQWWAWGSPSELGITNETTLETLPPSSPGRVIAVSLTHKDFTVVESFPTPPSLNVTLELTLSPSPISTQNAEDTSGEPNTAPPSFRITITNGSSQAITVKSNHNQPTIRPIRYAFMPESVHPRLTYQQLPPNPKNFSLIDTASGEELNPLYVSPSASPSGYNSQRNFTTLQPSVPLTVEMELPSRLVERARGRVCRLTVRPFGVWWTWGTVDELFTLEDGKPMKRILKEQKPPLILHSDDHIILEI